MCVLGGEGPKMIMPTPFENKQYRLNNNNQMQNIRDVAASFLRKQENQQSNKQTRIRLFVLVTVAL